MAPPDSSHYFGGDDEGGYVDWSSARMIGKGGFAIVYCASLKHVRGVNISVMATVGCQRNAKDEFNVGALFPSYFCQ